MQGDLIIGMVIDKSGSMSHVREQTIASVNQFLSEQAAQPGRTWVTLTVFNSNDITTLYRTKAAKDVYLDLESYVTDYSTPLHDAIGRTLRYMEEDINALPLDAHDAKKLFVIVTDGAENASKEFKLDAIKTLIQQREGEGWDFLYLGAGIDSFGAEQMGIAKHNTVTSSHTVSGTQSLYGTVSANVSAYRNFAGSTIADVAAAVQKDVDEDDDGN